MNFILITIFLYIFLAKYPLHNFYMNFACYKTAFPIAYSSVVLTSSFRNTFVTPTCHFFMLGSTIFLNCG